jgi:hypothetical protein
MRLRKSSGRHGNDSTRHTLVDIGDVGHFGVVYIGNGGGVHRRIAGVDPVEIRAACRI